MIFANISVNIIHLLKKRYAIDRKLQDESYSVFIFEESFILGEKFKKSQMALFSLMRLKAPASARVLID